MGTELILFSADRNWLLNAKEQLNLSEVQSRFRETLRLSYEPLRPVKLCRWKQHKGRVNQGFFFRKRYWSLINHFRSVFNIMDFFYLEVLSKGPNILCGEFKCDI